MHKILIAEDDDAFRTYILASLEKYKDRFVTIAAPDGLEAIRILQKEPVSILVTDLRMPRVEGLVLLAYVNRNHPGTPCVVMTSMRKPKLKEKLQKDVLRYIEKPFKADELAQVILSALEEKQPGGRMQGIAVTSFLQLIQMEQKTCICEIETPMGMGRFYFKNGAPVNASWRGLEGEAAAAELIVQENAVIHFRTEPFQTEQKIKKDLTTLILESVQAKEEKKAIQSL